MSDGEIGYAFTDNTYSSGEVKVTERNEKRERPCENKKETEVENSAQNVNQSKPALKEGVVYPDVVSARHTPSRLSEAAEEGSSNYYTADPLPEVSRFQSPSNESTSTGELKNQIDSHSDISSEADTPDLIHLLHKCEKQSSGRYQIRLYNSVEPSLISNSENETNKLTGLTSSPVSLGCLDQYELILSD
jgi:hypothetical protein